MAAMLDSGVWPKSKTIRRHWRACALGGDRCARRGGRLLHVGRGCHRPFAQAGLLFVLSRRSDRCSVRAAPPEIPTEPAAPAIAAPSIARNIAQAVRSRPSGGSGAFAHSSATSASKSRPAYTDLWVEGEISNCRPAPSGHVYFTLKDGEAQLPVVLFRRQALLLRFRPADGLAVLVRGRISVYETPRPAPAYRRDDGAARGWRASTRFRAAQGAPACRRSLRCRRANARCRRFLAALASLRRRQAR